MAELATGAVSSLLGVIRNEGQLLSGIKGDVQFIKEEMESMNSFPAHLARTAPAHGEHDEQVRTWMNQVRFLAQDCNNCIDLYLYRGNAVIHLARSGLRRYLWWVPWFAQKLVAQHRAANQLRELKEQARDVGKRRLRYGVEVPDKAKKTKAKAAGQSSPPPSSSLAHQGLASLAAAAGEDDDDDDEDEGGDRYQAMVATTVHHYSGCLQLPTLDDFFKGKLVEWMKDVAAGGHSSETHQTASIAFVAPDTADQQDALGLAQEALAAKGTRIVLVDIPALHHGFLPLRPKEIIYYILRELGQQGPPATEGPKEQQHLSDWQAYIRKWDIYIQKRRKLSEIMTIIKEMKVEDKLDDIERDIIRAQKAKSDQLQKKGIEQHVAFVEERKKGIDQKPLAELLQQLLQRGMDDTATSYDQIIEKTAKKLKEHMEEKQKPGEKEQEAVAAKNQPNKQVEKEKAAAKQQEGPIRLHQAQYEAILREAFPNKQQEEATQVTETTLGKDQIKQMIEQATLDKDLRTSGWSLLSMMSD